MTPCWRQRRWLLLPNRPLLAGDEVLPQDMSTCTLRTTASSSAAFQCFVQACMEASSTWEFCACVQAGLHQTLLHHIVDPLVCLVHSYLERLSPLLGRIPRWRTWYKFVDGPPTSESFFPSWASNNNRHCQTYLPHKGITKKAYVLQDSGMTVGNIAKGTSDPGVDCFTQ